MANRVNAAPTEHAALAKGESCNEMEHPQQSPDVDSRTLNMDCSGGSKVSPKHSTEGNGDGKPVKPGKDATGVVGKSGGSAKSAENEVFIPAPPPATNAWTKRMQASCSAAKAAVEAGGVHDKPEAARSPSDSKQPAAAQKQSPTHTPTGHSAESDINPQSSSSRLEGSTQPESTSSVAVGSAKQPSAKDAETPSSSKQSTEAKSKPGSDASSKAEVQVKATSSSASDAAPSGCWKIPVQSAACETSFAQGLTASKQHSADPSSSG